MLIDLIAILRVMLSQRHFLFSECHLPSTSARNIFILPMLLRHSSLARMKLHCLEVVVVVVVVNVAAVIKRRQLSLSL